jgi:hypothetical protein
MAKRLQNDAQVTDHNNDIASPAAAVPNGFQQPRTDIVPLLHDQKKSSIRDIQLPKFYVEVSTLSLFLICIMLCVTALLTKSNCFLFLSLLFENSNPNCHISPDLIQPNPQRHVTKMQQRVHKEARTRFLERKAEALLDEEELEHLWSIISQMQSAPVVEHNERVRFFFLFWGLLLLLLPLLFYCVLCFLFVSYFCNLTLEAFILLDYCPTFPYRLTMKHLWIYPNRCQRKPNVSSNQAHFSNFHVINLVGSVLVHFSIMLCVKSV